MVHYVAQVKFRGESLSPRISDMSVFSNIEDLRSFLEKSNFKYECEVSTNQNERARIDMAEDYAERNQISNDDFNEKQFLINYVKTHNYILIFPVFKLNITKENGNFTKFKEAAFINHHIYLLSNSDKKGVFNSIQILE